MKKNIGLMAILLFALLFAGETGAMDTKSDTPRIVLVIHGGAGTMSKETMTPKREKEFKAKLSESLKKGYAALKAGKSSIDAVQAAINVLEDSPLFNAGKGAVFTHDGRNELDASIMNGANLEAGAVAGVTTVKNPIDAARAVMEQSKHVMLAGKGAELFAKEAGCTIVDTSYFFTEHRWRSLQRAIEREKKASAGEPVRTAYANNWQQVEDEKFGTVGAVAIDNSGNITAGTSTGGMVNKKHGRIGDSPVIGAGNYANNATAGISCTGTGEYFIRTVAAKRISDLMELKGLSLRDAMQAVVKEIGDLGGTGGIIGLDSKGRVAMEFNTAGMYRGTIDENGKISVMIFK